MKAIFLSDVHLRDSESVKSRLVIRFLQEVASRFEHVYILGDLFDVWPGTSSYLIKSFQPVLQTLRRLVEDGHKVHYLEGNHDFRLGDYFKEAGIQVYPDKIVETWNGRRIYMEHGDLGNPKEVGYKVLRRLLRAELLHFALRAVPSEWVFNVGLRSSKLSRGYQTKVPTSEDLIRTTYRNTAKGLFQKGYDVVIMGHTHLPDDFTQEVDGRTCRYLNSGDWVKNFTYLEYDGSEFYTRTHPVKSL